MANEFKIKKGLIVTGASGGTVVDIQGSQGQLFSVTDDLSGSIFAVSDISGVPIFDVNSSGLSTFDGDVNLPDIKKILLGTGNDFQLYHDGTHGVLNNTTGNLYTSALGAMIFRTSLNVTALTLDTSQNATFAGDVTVEGSHLKILNHTGAYEGAATDYLYVGGSGLDGTDGAIYLGNSGNNTGYGWRFFYLGSGSGNGNKLIIRSENAGSGVDALSFTQDGNSTFATQAFSAATSSGDGSSTLTTKGYVDSLITGATIYRGAWDPSGGGYGSPDLSGVTQTSGYYYICSAVGIAEPNGSGCEPNSWDVGDWVIWNDDVTDCAGTGTGAWQKIDNSSVLSGIGTGQTVALWEGDSSVTDSETLGNAPITVSGNNTTFAGNVIAEGSLITRSVNANVTISGDTSGNIYYNNASGEHRWKANGSSVNSMNLSSTLLTVNEPATFTGIITVNGGGIDIDNDDDIRLRFDNASTFKAGLQVATTAGDMIAGSAINDFAIRAQENMLFSSGGNVEVLKLDTSGNAVFAGLVSGITPVAAANFVTKAYVDGGGGAGSGFLPLSAGSGFPLTGDLYMDKVGPGILLKDGTQDVAWLGDFGGGTDGQLVLFDNAGASQVVLNGQAASYFNGGNVGINETSPQNTLHVNGTLRVGPYFATSDRDHFLVTPGGSVTTVSTPNENANYDNSAGNIHIRTNSGYATPVERLTVLAGGNVGIGTTSNINAPLTVQADGSAGAINLIGRSNGVYDESIISFYDYDGTTRKGYILNSGGNMFFATGNGSENMTILSGGNVGIGTTLPTSQLFVNNTADGDKIRWGRSDALVGSVGTFNGVPYIGYQGGAGGGIMFNGASIEPTLLGSSRSSGTNDIGSTNYKWKNGWFSDTLRSHDAIFTGNVGIGTTLPTTALTIGKAISPTAYGAQASMIEFKSYYTGYDTETVKSAIYSGVSDVAGLQTTRGFMSFWTADFVTGGGESLTEKMRIESNGNVGIGTDSPAAKLEVFGTGNSLRLDSAANGSKEILFRNVGTGTATIKTDGDLKLFVEDAGKNILFNTTGGEKMRIEAGGNVGIGTTTFNNYWSGYAVLKLGADNGFFSNIASGTGSALFIAQNVYNDGSIYRHVRTNESGLVDMRDGKFSFLTSPSGSAGAAATMTNRFTILQGGNVGIGTDSPSTPLQIGATTSGNQRFSSGSYGEWWTTETYPRVFLSRDGAASGVSALQFGVGSSAVDTTIQRLPSGPGVALMGGNVGIGVTGPNGLLHVRKDQASETKVIIQNNNGAGAGVRLELSVGEPGSDDSVVSFNVGNGGADWSVGVDNSDADKFKISGGTDSHNPNLGANNKLTITTGGNVGIGTTTPLAKLDIQGTQGQLFSVTDDLSGSIFAVSDISGVPIFDVNSSGVSYFDGKVGIGVTGPGEKLEVAGNIQAYGATFQGTTGSVIALKSSGATLRATIKGNNNGLELGVIGNKYINFEWDGVTKIQMRSTGRLGIGTGTAGPDSLLEIEGATNSSTSNLLRLSRATQGSGPEKVAGFYSGTSGERGYITVSNFATAYNTSSDYRLKENIKPIEDSVERLMSLKPCNFNFISEEEDKIVMDGFIAHEAKEVVPEAVTGIKDAVDEKGNPMYQGIDQSKIVPLLTAALQQALQRIEILEQKLNN